MPAQSLIIGVDLSPIKPIPRAITFQSDITTEKCRATIKSHIKHWKADIVLHDGAPNVGAAWVQDAFSQAELVLESLRLATDFLAEGGSFVTKVFRSKDYNPLLWVFKQLFTSVEATKPPSSRNVSAEIFVVCRGYKAPKRIDPKFLDPKHVFAELSAPTPNYEAKVFNPEKKKRKREGYEEGDYTQFKELPVTEFINTTDPISILGGYNKLSFQQPPGGDLAMSTLERLEDTTEEIRTCCEDLKVLGKKEFRNLLRWRIKVREKFGLVVKKKAQEGESEEVAEVAPMDEELAIQEDLMRMREQETAKGKKQKRKENEKKRKEIVRLQMNMTTPMEIGMEQLGMGGDDTTFSLKRVDREGARDKVFNARDLPAESESEDDGESEDEESDDEGDRLERELDTLYEKYQERKEDKDSKLRAKKNRKEYEKDEWDGFSDENKGSDDEEEQEQEDEDEDEEMADSKTETRPGNLSNNASLFFDQDIFQDLGVEEEDEEEEEEEQEEEEEEEEGDNIFEMDDDSDAEEKATASKQKNKKDAKKNAKKDSEWEDESDEGEPVDLGDPKKANGQLGKKLPLIFTLLRFHH
jgi:AdoMet-dependent rRNA methyltransferase SPB1